MIDVILFAGVGVICEKYLQVYMLSKMTGKEICDYVPAYFSKQKSFNKELVAYISEDKIHVVTLSSRKFNKKVNITWEDMMGVDYYKKTLNTPQLIITEKYLSSVCPSCKRDFHDYEICDDGYWTRATDKERCPYCGQAIKWNE